jgi:hypothetical protein
LRPMRRLLEAPLDLDHAVEVGLGHGANSYFCWKVHVR